MYEAIPPKRFVDIAIPQLCGIPDGEKSTFAGGCFASTTGGLVAWGAAVHIVSAGDQIPGCGGG
jgi:hypothetical protein